MRHLQSSLQPVSSSKLYLTIKKSKIKMMAKSTLEIWRLLWLLSQRAALLSEVQKASQVREDTDEKQPEV